MAIGLEIGWSRCLAAPNAMPFDDLVATILRKMSEKPGFRLLGVRGQAAQFIPRSLGRVLR